MPENVKNRRRYTSSLRREQAEETRRRILDAAHDLFLTHGYTTTIDAIANEAQVAVQTVYAGFGNKRGILFAVLERAIGGDDQPIGMLERPDPARMRGEPDQRRQLEMMARGIRRIMERAGPVFTVVRAAAVADPEIATRYERLQEERLDNMTRVLGWVSERGPLREGLTPAQGADILWTLTSADIHRLLTIERGWTGDQYERWLAGTLVASLLP